MKIDQDVIVKNVHEKPSGRDYAFIISKNKKYINDQKKEVFFSEFHSLISSGIDFTRTFELLIKGEKNGKIKSLLENLHLSVIEGDSLWEALSKDNNFNALDCGAVRIGEKTGKLSESLKFLSEYYYKKTVQKRIISGAISYPLIILITATLVLIFMMLVIVPMFEQVYDRLGGELPAITKSVIKIASNFESYLLIIFIMVSVITAFLVWNRDSDMVRNFKASILLKTPVLNNTLRTHYQSHFCKLMHLLYGSGIPLHHGIELLKDIIIFYPYQQSFKSMCERLNQGDTFADSIGRFPNLYDAKLIILVKVGEETNRLSDMLKKQGDDLAAELEHKLKQLGNMLEPVLILLVGILVAVVLISMYLPMFKLGNTIY